MKIDKIINKENYRLRLMQVLIFVLHIIMLKWILYVLYEGGTMTFNALIAHFVSLAAYGGLLIRFCAWYFKRQFEKENKKT